MLLLALPARAEEAVQEIDAAIDALDLSGWQAAADEAGADLDVTGTVRSLAQGKLSIDPDTLLSILRSILLGEAEGMGARLMALMGPALLWAVNRQLSRMGAASGLVCYLAGAGVMMSVFAGQLQRQSIPFPLLPERSM